MSRARAFVVALALAVGAGGCITRPAFMQPAPAREFAAVLAGARAASAAGRYADADRSLADFSARYPGSPQAVETRFWRALIQLDPANQNASLASALSDLDQYVAASPRGVHYDEALTLRRVAFELQTATRLASTTVTTETSQTARATPAPEDKARDAEIQRLRDSLARANDELERIKRRLVTPTRP